MIQNNNIVAMYNNVKNIALDTRSFQCDICHKYYNKKPNLNQHKKSVHTEKLFQCTLCPARFKTKTHLNIHQGKHSNEKPFSCTRCQKSYKSKKSLINHQKRNHSQHKPQWKQNVYSSSLILMENKRLINALALHAIQQQQALLNCQTTYMPTQNSFIYPPNANITIFNDLAGASDYKTTNELEQDFFLTT
jgi:uncharacterized Zn-finger protein